MNKKKMSDHKGVVLWADDEPYHLAMAIMCLEDEGWEVVRARDGDETLTLLDELHPRVDLVILDVMMPPGLALSARQDVMYGRRTGVVLGRIIRKRYPDLPILGCSVACDPDTQEWFERYGAGLLTKAFTIHELVSSVNSAVGAHKAGDEQSSRMSSTETTTAEGDGNMQVVGDGNLVMVCPSQLSTGDSETADSRRLLGLTRRQLAWTVAGVIAAIILGILGIWVQIRLARRPPMLPGTTHSSLVSQKGRTVRLPQNSGPPVSTGDPEAHDAGSDGSTGSTDKQPRPGGTRARQSPQRGTGPNQPNGIIDGRRVSQTAQGVRNVQIAGDGNKVDNRTYVTIATAAGQAQLTYHLSGLQRRADGHYQMQLTISSTGSVPVYKPVMRLSFDHGVLGVEADSVTASILVGVRESYDAGKTTYTYSVSEMSPGLVMRYTITSDIEFSIIGFRINDRTVI